MNNYITKALLKATKAKEIDEVETIQELWSGYGKILRVYLRGSEKKSVIVKHVRLPKNEKHPRGWNTDLSHQRKIKSYRIETAWYKEWSSLSTDNCKIPQCLALEKQGDEVIMILEDLKEAGYPFEKTSVNWNEMQSCISWLAYFHGTYLGEEPHSLWKSGTYWHLATRPDELRALKDIELKSAAQAIDTKLRKSPFQTFVHGDAKLANFCFSEDGKKAAAVDFQYVGGGCGMKDLAYFTGSCLYEDECEAMEDQILDFYFSNLERATKDNNKNIDFYALEENWRSLYHVAWADFHRFLKGWSPGHWKINSYSEKVVKKVISELN